MTQRDRRVGNFGDVTHPLCPSPARLQFGTSRVEQSVPKRETDYHMWTCTNLGDASRGHPTSVSRYRIYLLANSFIVLPRLIDSGSNPSHWVGIAPTHLLPLGSAFWFPFQPLVNNNGHRTFIFSLVLLAWPVITPRERSL